MLLLDYLEQYFGWKPAFDLLPDMTMRKQGVPLIDMQKLDTLSMEIVKASEEWGCFRIVNHGVPMDLMAEMKAVVASLFYQPEEIKMLTVHTEPGKGYVERNLASPFFEGLSIDDISGCGEFYDRINASLHQRKIINNYIKAIRELARLLGVKLMEGSGLSGDLFNGWCCQLRMNKYHFSPESEGSDGLPIHTDPTFLTILQDDENVNGLQIIDENTGEFIPVDPVPGTLVVNIGDIGKAWSNGRYWTAEHRVQCLEPKTRYSIALFVLGPNDRMIEAPSLFVDGEHPRSYLPFDPKKYRDARITHHIRTGVALELFRTSVT